MGTRRHLNEIFSWIELGVKMVEQLQMLPGCLFNSIKDRVRSSIIQVEGEKQEKSPAKGYLFSVRLPWIHRCTMPSVICGCRLPAFRMHTSTDGHHMKSIIPNYSLPNSGRKLKTRMGADFNCVCLKLGAHSLLFDELVGGQSSFCNWLWAPSGAARTGQV